MFGAAVTLVGVGSVMFHEGDSDLGAWAHDWAIGALLVVLGLSGGLQGRRVSIGSAVLAAIALLYALTPSSGEWVNGALVIIVVAREARVRHLRRRAQFRLAVRLAAVGGAAHPAGQDWWAVVQPRIDVPAPRRLARPGGGRARFVRRLSKLVSTVGGMIAQGRRGFVPIPLLSGWKDLHGYLATISAAGGWIALIGGMVLAFAYLIWMPYLEPR